MPVIKLLIEFDGTDFHGWQSQPDDRTVQDVLTEAVRTLVKEKVNVEGSSRTDAGVHARAMPVVFAPSAILPLKAYVEGLNRLLPDDVIVHSAEEVSDDFHIRRSSCGKTYRYRIRNHRVGSALSRRFAWHFKKPLDVERMQAGAEYLLGTHDYTSFRSAHCDSLNPIRELHSIRVERIEDEVVIEIHGNAFLRNMVRIMVGTLLRVGEERLAPEDVASILAARDRNKAGPTAPPHGLCLMEVRYP